MRRPFDPGLRRALRGEPGERGDGLGEVRTERRRLGLGESRDAPILRAIGRRANAVAVAIVRAGEDGPELVMFDVRHAAFFEGALPLSESTAPSRIGEFVFRRARAASRRRSGGLATPFEAAASAQNEETSEPEEPAPEPDFFEQYWPYFVAGAALIGMIIAIAVTAATAVSTPPVLRFVPGGR